jgi:acetyl-CoA carboxylase carboxyl transferase subunit alpha
VVAAKGDAVAIGEELTRLEAKAEKALADLYANLTPWQKTQVARHPQRPHFSDYVRALLRDFTPLSGDRQFGEDPAIVGGFGWFRGRAICVLGRKKAPAPKHELLHSRHGAAGRLSQGGAPSCSLPTGSVCPSFRLSIPPARFPA